MKNIDTIKENSVVTLYHGSKPGLRGAIAPISRKHCDFGKGFYMGTERTQPLTLICNYPGARIYTLSINLSNLKILDVEVGLDWALLVTYNRGKMENAKNAPIYNKFANFSKDCDVIISYIANDRMFVVLDRFFNGEITDIALINSLSALKLGKQYAALTEKACKKIRILDENEYDCPAFIEAFMNSHAAACLDDVYDRLQWAGEEYILDELDDEVHGLKKAGITYSDEVMYWTGYVYRYWHYYTKEYSRDIYKIADAEMMSECWLGFHTLDVAMAIDDLKEIYHQKNQ